MIPFFRSRGAKKKLLLSSPRPVFHQSDKGSLALFFSAKAGCTFAVQWFFSQTGLLQAAQAYHPSVHRYRIKVHCQSADYLDHITSITRSRTKVIKVVRNPFTRAASSYLHAVGHDYENQAMAQFLGRDVDEKQGFSFREFVDYLESIDLATCNPHHRIQCHAAEMEKLVAPDYIVKLENSFAELREVEEVLSLPQTPRETMEAFADTRHATARTDFAKTVADDRFSKSTLGAQQPLVANFYDGNLMEKVRGLYAIDFRVYHYDESTLSSAIHDTLDERRKNFGAIMGKK